MIKVRVGMFETNSSSSHSIAIMKDRDNFKGVYSEGEFRKGIYIQDDGAWVIFDDDDLCFSRYPYRVLCTFEDKFLYAIASLCPSCDTVEEKKKKLGELTEIAKKYLKGLKEVKLPMVSYETFIDDKGNYYGMSSVESEIYTDENDGKEYVEYYVEEDGKRIPVFRKDDGLCFGDIDHQSFGLLKEFLEKYKVTVEEFLTNKKYLVIIDGDEYHEFEKMVEFGIFPRSKINKVFGIYGERTLQKM